MDDNTTMNRANNTVTHLYAYALYYFSVYVCGQSVSKFKFDEHLSKSEVKQPRKSSTNINIF